MTMGPCNVYVWVMFTKHQVIVRHGTNAAQFARDIGATKQQVHNWGDRVPPHWAMRVSRVTGIPVEHLLPEAEHRDGSGASGDAA